MAGPNKRASMREGPLAALFRKTEDGEEGDAAAEAPAGEERSSAASAPAATTAQAGTRPSRAEPRESPEPERLPHPALNATVDDSPAEDVRVPTPRERLRHAFSSE